MCGLQVEADGRHCYHVMLHNGDKYPSRTSEDSAGSTEPRLIVAGNFKACNYWFQECQFREQRRIARVDRNLEEGGGGHAKDSYLVQVAASVDVALILLCTMIIDACEQDEDNNNDNHTGRYVRPSDNRHLISDNPQLFVAKCRGDYK